MPGTCLQEPCCYYENLTEASTENQICEKKFGPGQFNTDKMMDLCETICNSSILMPSGAANIMLGPDYREKACQAPGEMTDEGLCSEPIMTRLLMVVYNNTNDFRGNQNALKALMDASAQIPNESKNMTDQFNKEYANTAEELRFSKDDEVAEKQMNMKSNLTEQMMRLPSVKTLKDAIQFISDKTGIIRKDVTTLTSRLVEQFEKCQKIVSFPRKRQLCSSGLSMVQENRAAGKDMYVDICTVMCIVMCV